VSPCCERLEEERGWHASVAMSAVGQHLPLSLCWLFVSIHAHKIAPVARSSATRIESR
jgi:hypothetical protein